MKKYFLPLFSILILATNAFTQIIGIPTTEILTNTFFIVTDTTSGTCFLVEESGNEYIVSARHLFKKGIKNGDAITFHLDRGGVFEPFTGNIYLSDNSTVDIVVIKIPKKLSYIKPYSNIGSYSIGQDSYFLGFPYKERLSTKMTGGRIPLVKKALISAFYKNNGAEVVFLDGHNNPGFSGGPVIAYDYYEKNNSVIGVISGYYPQSNEGKIKAGKAEIPFSYSENSGIIITYPSRYYVEIINKIK